MRFWGWTLPTLGAALLSASTAQAGVYNPGERDELYAEFINGPRGHEFDFHTVLFMLRSIPDPLPQVDNPMRRRYIFQDELLKKTPFGGLKTMADRLQASAVLIRRRKFKEAEEVLRPVAMQQTELDNIPLQSNFATALHLSGNLQAAVDTLRPVVNLWKNTRWDDLPEPRCKALEQLGWHQLEYDRFRNSDAAYLRLLRLRLREQLAKKAGKARVQPPDALFETGEPLRPVRFMTDSGEYTAGSIPDALPNDALGIVQQLVAWLPDDLRLYWLLGDVYNAQRANSSDKENESGIRAANQIFTELSKIESISEDAQAQLRRRLGVLGPAVERFDRERTSKIEINLDKLKKDDGIQLDWRTVGVAFGAGFLLALGAVWQVREIQRRRQVAQAKQQSRSA